MKCKYCGTENELGYRYCEKCGTPLFVPSARPPQSASKTVPPPAVPSSKKNSKPRFRALAVGAAILIALVIAVFIFTLAANPSAFTAQLPEPTRAPTVTRTPRATLTVEFDPVATPTQALSNLSPAEIEYAVAVAKIVNSYASAMEQLGKQLSDASENPTLALSGDWRVETASKIVVIKNNGIALRKLNPPPSFSSVQKDAEEAAQHYDSGMDLIIAGLNEVDSKKTQDALKELNLGKAAITRVADALKGRK